VRKSEWDKGVTAFFQKKINFTFDQEMLDETWNYFKVHNKDWETASWSHVEPFFHRILNAKMSKGN